MASWNHELSFTFDDNSVVCPPIKVNEVLFRKSEVVNMLLRNHSCDAECKKVLSINFQMFNREAFIQFLSCIERDETFPLSYFYEIVDIICYFILDETLVDLICPTIPTGQMRLYLKAMHQLLCHNYVQAVEKKFRECRIPTFLCKNFDTSFHKFKKKYISAARFQEWYQTKCQVNCCCSKCTEFRSKRFLKLFDGEGYADPFYGHWKNSPFRTEKLAKS